MPAHLQLPLYTAEQPLDQNHGHDAPRLPQRGSWMSRVLVGVVVLLCCGLMILCMALAVAVSGYKIEQRSGLLDGAPLFAHAHLTVDTTASPPPPSLRSAKLPSHIANQLHRIRQLEILDGELTEANLKHIFPYWWHTDGSFKAAVAMADVVTTLSHLSLAMDPSTETVS